ncbi:VRK1 [Cordylochernes scorpioides]|uniref:VRK1 n=1 Tax=Cordylochernes scorpioides TaxID=51811 RepID=A0ABY6KJT7_9ARAC|nr:VRK1 [Cordylochernes scorpioides]
MPGHRKRRQFKQTDAFTRGMVIGLKWAGWSIRQIAADTHLGASTVHRLWRRWLEQGNVAIYRNVGATRVTSARVDRRILRQAVAAPQATCTAFRQHVQDTLDHSISTRTISRRLVANGLHSCRPLRRLPLTPPNRRQRLEWCRARSTWMTEWHRVVFSDESRFCLSSDSRRVRVWRRRGERSNPAAIVERPTVRQRGIMVWGAIAYDSRSPLLRIQGTMTAQRYVDDVLRPVTLPYLQGVPNALYQQDNARPHTASISQQALQDVQMLPWPPYSPDLSPIEHVWDIIGRRLHALPQPRSEDELWQMVERECRAIPQDAIRTLIDSLPRRVAACIAVCEAFGDAALSRSRTFEWLSRFLKGREKVNDDQHTGRPRSLRCEENKLKIKELIKSNRRISIKDLSSETGLSIGLCHQIVTKDLDMIRTSSKFVPRILTEEQKEVRMDVCKNMVEMTRTDPEWMQKIITGDETWVYQYDPETKRQSSQWIERGEPKPKKARFTKSKVKTLLVTFFNILTVWFTMNLFLSDVQLIKSMLTIPTHPTWEVRGKRMDLQRSDSSIHQPLKISKFRDTRGKQWILGKRILTIPGHIDIHPCYEEQPQSEKPRYIVKFDSSRKPGFIEGRVYTNALREEWISQWKDHRNFSFLGVPRYISIGTLMQKGKRYRFIINDHYGKRLSRLLNKDYPLTIGTVLGIGINVLRSLEFLHSHGYAHNDVQADNLLMERSSSNPIRVYLMNYSHAQMYINDGVHVRYYGETIEDYGIQELKSRDAHVGVPSRRSDLEALGFCMVHWLGATLPWYGESTAECYKQKKSLMMNPHVLLKSCFPNVNPTGLTAYFKYIANLSFKKTPDYNYLTSCLLHGIKKAGDVRITQ